MPYCENCGAQISDTAKFCTECGTPCRVRPKQETPPMDTPVPEIVPVLTQPTVQLPEVSQPQPEVSRLQPEVPQPQSHPRKGMAALAYLGILVLIPLLFARKDSFARAHASQGLTLYLLTLICNALSELLLGQLTEISPILTIAVYTVLGACSVLLFVCSVVGFVRALGGKTKELPLIGKIKFLR